MSPERRRILVDVMARWPGEPDMEFAFLDEFGAELRSTLVALAAGAGMAPLEPGELRGLVVDAAEEIGRIAPSWRPDGGALPWVYGRQRLLALLRRHAGPRTTPLPERFDAPDQSLTAPPASGPDDPPAMTVLDQLVTDDDHPVLVLLRDAFEQVLSPADAEVILLYAQQQSADDPSPSHTVAALVERSPDAVRQANSRGRRKLRTLAVSHRRYRPLLTLPILADGGPDGGRAA